MKKALIITALLLLTLAACTQQQATITTVGEALDRIVELDEKHKTSFRGEQVNKYIPELDEEAYLADLDEARKKVEPASQDHERWIGWLFSAREQMLRAQIAFQQAWAGIGEPGRVSDGFQCSDYPFVRNSTLLLEESYVLGKNATGILDSLLQENVTMRERIGIGQNRPELYSSKFERIEVEIQSNVVAMHEFCNKTIKTEYFNYTQAIENADINKSKYVEETT